MAFLSALFMAPQQSKTKLLKYNYCIKHKEISDFYSLSLKWLLHPCLCPTMPCIHNLLHNILLHTFALSHTPPTAAKESAWSPKDLISTIYYGNRRLNQVYPNSLLSNRAAPLKFMNKIRELKKERVREQ